MQCWVAGSEAMAGRERPAVGSGGATQRTASTPPSILVPGLYTTSPRWIDLKLFLDFDHRWQGQWSESFCIDKVACQALCLNKKIFGILQKL